MLARMGWLYFGFPLQLVFSICTQKKTKVQICFGFGLWHVVYFQSISIYVHIYLNMHQMTLFSCM